jgi:predicted RNase H-like HicB family nuclease
MRYMVVIEEGPASFGVYVPDLPGCIAVGESAKEVLKLIQEAIEFHIEDLKEKGQQIQMPHSSSSFIEIQATPSQNFPARKISTKCISA